ncbi:tail fiber assembly protein [Plesiomonas shigelloides]|uniref:tail fiber assembly protein n=1 Tax=Plesiomonas shigelloides TaxID=703 RepID=UPI0015B7078D|nr:tail fiber assembly protein [Plesiomonas shigelloides]
MEIEILSAHSPVWANSEKTAVSLMVRFSHLSDSEVPFTASSDDPAEHGRELYVRAVFGDFGAIGEFVAEPVCEADLLAELDGRLKQAALAMAPLEDAEKLGVINELEKASLAAWRQYRIALYRLPQSKGWLSDFDWPIKPE